MVYIPSRARANSAPKFQRLREAAKSAGKKINAAGRRIYNFQKARKIHKTFEQKISQRRDIINSSKATIMQLEIKLPSASHAEKPRILERISSLHEKLADRANGNIMWAMRFVEQNKGLLSRKTRVSAGEFLAENYKLIKESEKQSKSVLGWRLNLVARTN